MYAALLLPNKELLEMRRQKQESKELHHLNMMLGTLFLSEAGTQGCQWIMFLPKMQKLFGVARWLSKD